MLKTSRELDLARVLVVDDNPASRLTLETVLKAGGYQVDSAASASEAFDLLDNHEYQLVISDLRMEAPESGLRVLAHARMMEYRPATALLTAYSERQPTRNGVPRKGAKVLIQPEALPELLAKVAELISERAARRVHRELRVASA